MDPSSSDATPNAAPVEAGQPAVQAVDSTPVAPVVEALVATSAEPSAVTETTSVQPTVNPLEQELDTIRKRYADSSAEALRLYRENESLKASKPTAPTQATPPTYSPEQLETWKEKWLVESGKAAVLGDDTAAANAAHQVRLIDAELRKGEISQFTTRQTSQAAYQKLSAEVQPILEQYKTDLAPGMPVYHQAQQLYQDAVTAGAPANDITATSAVLLALAKSGKFVQGVTMKASQQATTQLNQALKTAAVAGGGGSNAGRSATPDLASMNSKQFEDYRKSIGVTRP